MKENRFFTLLSFIIFAISATAQIKGVVKDSITKEPIAYVSVWVENKNIGVTSEKDGSFLLDISSENNLQFSMLGYKNKISKINNSGVYYLSQKEMTIEEVVVKKTLKKKEKIVIGNSKKRFFLPETQFIPWIFAKKFQVNENLPDVKFIEKISFFTKSEVEDGSFRVRIFSIDENDMPKDDILLEEKIVNVKKGKHETIVDLSDLNIEVPKEGIIVGFESLILFKNMYFYEGVMVNSRKKIRVLNYSPHIMYQYNEKEESYTCRKTWWIKQKTSMFGNGKVIEPAINITLTN